ncbi:MAG: SPOR domain-containing protein [Acidiferrobacterales bacterium]
MPETNNPRPEFNPKHRIVGAIVLVVLAIIFVPVILNEKRLTTQDIGNGITLPEKDTRVYVSKAEDIRRAQNNKNGSAKDGSVRDRSISNKGSSHSNKETQKKKAMPPVKTSTPPVVKKPESKKSATSLPKTKTADKTKSSPKEAKTDKVLTKGWVVQIGTFSDPANAKKVRATLVRKGYHVRMEKVRLPKGDATRVRVGPFSDRGKAITTLSRISRDVGLQGVVLRYP